MVKFSVYLNRRVFVMYVLLPYIGLTAIFSMEANDSNKLSIIFRQKAPCEIWWKLLKRVSLFVLRFYSPVNLVGSGWMQSVYVTTLLLCRFCPLNGQLVLRIFLSPETDNCLSWINGRERMIVENISWSISTPTPAGTQAASEKKTFKNRMAAVVAILDFQSVQI